MQTIILDSQKFLFALKWCNKINSKNAVLSVLENCYCKIDEGRLFLYSTNLSSGISISYPIESKVNISFLMNKELINTLYGSSKLQINIDEINVRYIIDDTINVKYEYLMPEDYPIFPEVEGEKAFDIQKKDFNLLRYKTFLTTDELRIALTGINLEAKEGRSEIELAASDGHKLIVQKKSVGFVNRDINTIFGYEFAALISKLNKDQILDFYITKSHIKCVTSWNEFDFNIFGRLITTQYPDFKATIPKNNDKQIKINTYDFISAVIKCIPFTNRVTRQIDVNINQQCINAADMYRMIEFSHGLEIVATSNEIAFLRFNAFFLKYCLNVVESEIVTMSYTTAAKPVLIEEEGTKIIIMPIIIY